ncbi:hypothetical protein BDN71DRAFT_1433014 [Pleurotus eryngii]|uniref:Uncharacterized protein n=1 Tax=Pleurotus eryngii TaxID=5323 RepID=A0A9P6DDF1_PLEER|nr:hypothetical protein BDN71DRAFT_1433014 [Pleurotus eryngii]
MENLAPSLPPDNERPWCWARLITTTAWNVAGNARARTAIHEADIITPNAPNAYAIKFLMQRLKRALADGLRRRRLTKRPSSNACALQLPLDYAKDQRNFHSFLLVPTTGSPESLQVLGLEEPERSPHMPEPDVSPEEDEGSELRFCTSVLFKTAVTCGGHDADTVGAVYAGCGCGCWCGCNEDETLGLFWSDGVCQLNDTLVKKGLIGVAKQLVELSDTL